MDNKRAKKLVRLLRRRETVVNGVGDQYWHMKYNVGR